jgi:hypothetical protein
MQKVCELCGHQMAFEVCGYATVYVEEDRAAYLCHADDHDCYHRWTVYHERPSTEIKEDRKK